MKRTLMFFTITVLIGLTVILVFPYYSINPGVLVKGHSNLRNNCFACHSIGEGAPTNNCISCHNISEIGIDTSAGSLLDKTNNKTNLLHKSIKDIKCYYCHTEHNGLSKENATFNFTHSVLPKRMLAECAGCHSEKKPDNSVHNFILSDCSACHNTENWKRAEFKHELLGKKKNECNNCHTNKIPDDSLHKGLADNIQCVHCHNTIAWKPSTFDHSKYFRFDSSHPSDCSKCHNVNRNLKSYSCYNCHEHQPSQIAKKHLKEGISDFNNCVKCHRSGDGDEAKGKEKEDKTDKERNED